MPMIVFSLPASARTIQHRADVHAQYHRILCLLIADIKVIFATMATILTSCLEREGRGDHRCIACQKFEEAVQKNASRVRNKNIGDTGKLYKCTKKVYMSASPSILHRRNSYSVRGREAFLGSAATAAIPAVPCGGTPKRNRRSKHSPTHTYKVPTSDEFKKKKHQMCEHHEKEQDEQQSAYH
jgi:hypothetical protein